MPANSGITCQQILASHASKFWHHMPANSGITCQQILATHALNTNCLAASNDVCTKSMAWFGLVENEVSNNSQTWPLIHLTSLTTFYSNIFPLKWKTWQCTSSILIAASNGCDVIVQLQHMSYITHDQILNTPQWHLQKKQSQVWAVVVWKGSH